MILKLTLPTSKSEANRFLIAAAIQKGESTIENISSSTDVKNLLNALNQIGLDIEVCNSTIKIRNSFPIVNQILHLKLLN